MGTYVSCGCGWCQGAPSKFKVKAKKLAHRLMRRRTRAALEKGREPPVSISTAPLY